MTSTHEYTFTHTLSFPLSLPLSSATSSPSPSPFPFLPHPLLLHCHPTVSLITMGWLRLVGSLKL